MYGGNMMGIIRILGEWRMELPGNGEGIKGVYGCGEIGHGSV